MPTLSSTTEATLPHQEEGGGRSWIASKEASHPIPGRLDNLITIILEAHAREAFAATLTVDVINPLTSLKASDLLSILVEPYINVPPRTLKKGLVNESRKTSRNLQLPIASTPR
jgi:hypothetical protein